MMRFACCNDCIHLSEHMAIQSTNVASRQLVIFLTASEDVLLRGDANNRTASFGGATTSNFAY